MFTNLELNGFVDCLRQIPPVNLQAVSLLYEARQNVLTGGGSLAVPSDRVATATTELINYTMTCAALLNKLKYLTPIILTELECPAWPL